MQACIEALWLLTCHAGAGRPLINVCDRFDMVEDLTHYLYTNNMLRYIEGYVQKVSPAKAPQVVGSLLDCEAPDEFITNLILSVRSLIPVEGLCAEVRSRCWHALLGQEQLVDQHLVVSYCLCVCT